MYSELIFLCFYWWPLIVNSLIQEPLLLTPLIKSGNIDEARAKSAVPSFLETDDNISSHSGYLTVKEATSSHLFFWFFKSSGRDWKNSPVLLWLQGGPGWSSMFGLFIENGPYELTKTGIRQRKYPWTKDYNVVYIDNPIGTGYSYTEGYYVSSQEEIGEHLYEALKQFFQLFPELQENDFFATGESYAGKYIPSVAYIIHKRNPTAEQKINLKGLFIGNGYSDPENMFNYATYLHRLGLIDYKTKLMIESKQEREKVLIRSKQWTEAWERRRELFSLLLENTEFKYLYDYTHEKYAGDNLYVEFIKEDYVRKRIHVGKNNFTSFSQSSYDNLKKEIPQSTAVKAWIEELLEYYRIVFYSGQLDIIVAHVLATEFIQSLHWTGAELYKNAKRKKWYFKNHLVGYHKKAGNLIEVLVRGSSHMVPTSKPQVMLDLLEKFVRNKF